MATDLSGAVSLDRSILEECGLGSDRLPTKVRSAFSSDTSTLLTSILIERKFWLFLVRAAREIVQDSRIQDEFTNPQSYLRKGVGLYKGKHPRNVLNIYHSR